MKKRLLDNALLGMMVLAGMLVLVFALYLIGQDDALFQKNFVLKTRFENVGGLVAGHNVRYSGINVGTVKSVVFINDTAIEVTMLIREDMQQIIRKNAVASLGTDGIIGNKVVNLTPTKEGPADLVQPNDMIRSREEVSVSEIMETLHYTNQNVAVITDGLKETVHRINTSTQLATLLEDNSISVNLKAALVNIRNASNDAAGMMDELHAAIGGIERGEGTVGVLLKDTSLAYNLEEAVAKIQTVANHADQLARDLNQLTNTLDKDYNSGGGPASAILRDSVMTDDLRQTLRNVETGTAAFSENMEALKHNFLFRGYFKRQAKKAQKK
jgi:phospholipid/cholesterol/gamma-HCH transport system substrate-binding protein